MTAALLLAVASVQLECTYDFVRVPSTVMFPVTALVEPERGTASVRKEGNQIEIVEVVAGTTTRKTEKLPFQVDAKADLAEFLQKSKNMPIATQGQADILEALKSAKVSSVRVDGSVEINGIACRIQHDLTTINEQLSISFTSYIPLDLMLQERIGFVQQTQIINVGPGHIFRSEIRSNIKWKPLK